VAEKATLRHIATRKMKAAGRSVPKNRPVAFAGRHVAAIIDSHFSVAITIGSQFDSSLAEAVVFNLKPSRAGGSR